MKTSLLFLALFSISNLFGQTSGNGVTDIDGNFYDTVTIGNQVWMTKNLDVSTFRNGDPIPRVKTKSGWKKAWEEGKPAWCYYKNKKKNGKKYGKLYNWYAVNDPRGLAPKGWHVPSDAEWTLLTEYLGGHGNKMKSTSGWKRHNGTNSSGFNGLPGGTRTYDGAFKYGDMDAYWWSSTEYDMDDALLFILVDDFYGWNVRTNYPKEEGMSVRCLKD